MSKKQLTQEKIAKLENIIRDRHGDIAVQNPLSEWNIEKEKEYIDQLRKIYYKKNNNSDLVEKKEEDGFYLYKKLLNREGIKNCSICESILLKSEDDLYYLKFKCCKKCYSCYIVDNFSFRSVEEIKKTLERKK